MMRELGYVLIIVLLVFGCKKPYAPQVVASDNSYLVVEGIINSGSDSTIITLSRTTKLDQKVQTNSVHGATVTVENDQNFSFALNEDQTGRYVSPNLNLDNTRKYRLRIKTSDNQEYLSDFVSPKEAPPIDSIGYEVKNDGLDIYVNAHDGSNNTRYYRWEFIETWKFTARYPSSFVTNGKDIVLRTSAQQVFGCFGNDASSVILLGSTAKLDQDVIFQSPITSISSTSEKVMTKYSILLKQYALTKEAFSFWESLKKNTEQLGSIFDAQPSQLKGNIHNINNANEPVIGYISAGTIQKKRIFIDNGVLPRDWVRTYPYDCQLDSALYCHGSPCSYEVALYLVPIGSNQIPVGAILSKFSPATIGFSYSSRECVDCTIRGTTQPDFWQ
jgi:hypothetical protein